MALTNIWKLHSIMLVDGDASPTHQYIGSLSDLSMPIDANVVRDLTAGNIYATAGRIEFRSQGLTFTTMMVKKAIDLVGLGGICFPVAPAGQWDKIRVYLAKMDCGAPASGAVHREITLHKGAMVPTNLTVDHQGDLALSYQILGVYDGTNNPATVLDNVTLPGAGNFSDQVYRWTMHTAQINGVAMLGKKSINIDFGATTQTEGADSDPADSVAMIQSVLPIVTINGVLPTWFDTLSVGAMGSSVAHADSDVLFQRRDTTGVTAEHIKISFAGPAYFDNLAQGNATDPARTSVRVEPVEDSSGNAPLVIDTAATF